MLSESVTPLCPMKYDISVLMPQHWRLQAQSLCKIGSVRREKGKKGPQGIPFSGPRGP